MKAYTNKSDRIDTRKRLYSAIKKDSKGMKKAARRKAFQDIHVYIFLYLNKL